MKKLAIMCLPGLETFLENLVPFFQSNYMARLCISNQEAEIKSAVEWADIVWIEWMNELAAALTNSPMIEGKRVICRCHSYEALAGFVGKINWSKIDDMIFVAVHIRDLVMQQLAVNPNVKLDDFPCHVIPNGVDVDRYKFSHHSKGKRLGFIGNLSSKKGPMLLLHAFNELYRIDKEYTLYIAGRIDDPRFGLYQSYMVGEMGMGDNVFYEGYIKDIPGWLENKDYLMCTSPLESQGMGIMEAMVMGIKPVIHNFIGAKNIYDRKYLWTTISEFVEMVRSDEYNPLEYRGFVSKRYLLRHRLKDIKKLIDEPSQKKTVPGKVAYGSNFPSYNEYDYWNRRENPTAADMPPETTKRHIDYIRKHVGMKRVLDFGPGIGRTFKAYENVREVVGCDISKLYEERVRGEADKYDFKFSLKHISAMELDRLPFKDKEFSVAVAAEVLLHQRPQNILKVMKELERVSEKVVVISWMEDAVTFDAPDVLKEGPNHCFNFDYLSICKKQGWIMEDVQRINRQIYFVYRREKDEG